jgi:transcriptional regulator GlxA family with amidase domain
MHRVQDVIDTKFATTLPLANLARQAGVSERTVGFEDARMLRRLPAR